MGRGIFTLPNNATQVFPTRISLVYNGNPAQRFQGTRMVIPFQDTTLEFVRQGVEADSASA
jgi:hypothetical protein